MNTGTQNTGTNVQQPGTFKKKRLVENNKSNLKIYETKMSFMSLN